MNIGVESRAISMIMNYIRMRKYVCFGQVGYVTLQKRNSGVLGIMQTTVFHNLDSKMHRNLVMAHIYIIILIDIKMW